MSIQKPTYPRKQRRHRLEPIDRQPCQQLLNNLAWRPGLSPSRRLIALTSYRRGEGVSTIAFQLAVTAAGFPANVLLVDGNDQSPGIHQSFDIKAEQGFGEYLQSGDLEMVRATQVSHLSVMPVGKEPLRIGPELDFERVMDPLFDEFDLVVLDLPAIGTGPSMLRWAPFLECLLLVVSQSTDTRMASNAKHLVESAGGKIRGIVQNVV